MSTFDAITASRKVREAAILLADIDPGKCQLLHAFSQDIFEEHGRPDVELPDPDCQCGDEVHLPVGVVRAVDGEQFSLVNWHDYRGWEIRLSRSPYTVLGYMHSVLDGSDGGPEETFTVRSPGEAYVRSGFARRDAAIRALVSWAS